MQLINFILFNFLQQQIKFAAIFHCWQNADLIKFAKLSANYGIYAQLLDLRRNYNAWDFENRFLKYEQPLLGVFLQLNCENAEKIIDISNKQQLFSQHYHWLLYDGNANIINFRQLFENINFNVDADVTYVISKNSTSRLDVASSFITYDVYNNGWRLGGKLNITIDQEIVCDLQKCQVKQLLSHLQLRTKYDNRLRLSDITMNVATVITRLPLTRSANELIEYLSSEDHRNIATTERFGFHVFLVYKDLLGCNMSYKFKNTWSDNEVRGGAIGALMNHSVDLISTTIVATALRLRNITPIAENGNVRVLCVFRTPHNSGTRNIYIKPFATIVWFLLCLTVLLAGVILYFTFYLEHKRLKLHVDCAPSFLTILLVALGCACAQGSNLLPKTVGGRFALVTLLLLTFLMYNYYTSIIVSMLLSSPVKSNIKTLAQLADSNLDVGLQPIPHVFTYLNTSNLSDVRSFVSKKIDIKKNPSSVWMSLVNGVQRMRDMRGFGFVFEASEGYYHVNRLFNEIEICDLNAVVVRDTKGTVYTHVPKNSSYKEMLRLRATKMREAGIYYKIRRHWITELTRCYTDAILINVGMEYTLLLFGFLLGAYVFAFSVLILELCYKKYGAKSRKYRK